MKNGFQKERTKEQKGFQKHGKDIDREILFHIEDDKDLLTMCRLNKYFFNEASQYGHIEVVKYLVENGANISAQDDIALRWASQNRHIEVINYLKSL